MATGEKYVREAAESASSVRQCGGVYPICLITDNQPVVGEWDDVVFLEEPARSFRDKLKMSQAPYEQVLFLDTDTRVLAPLDDVFQVLEEFDIAVHQTPFGTWYDLPGVPKSFPEFNTGVIAFRKSGGTGAFFEAWNEWFDKLGRFPVSEDQVSFRKAIYHSDVRYAWLPAEYNIMPYMPSRVAEKLTIAHGRGGLDRMIREMNESSGDRAWVPRLGLIPTHNRASWPQLLRLWRRVGAMIGIEVLKRGLGMKLSPESMRKFKKMLGRYNS